MLALGNGAGVHSTDDDVFSCSIGTEVSVSEIDLLAFLPPGRRTSLDRNAGACARRAKKKRNRLLTYMSEAAADQADKSMAKFTKSGSYDISGWIMAQTQLQTLLTPLIPACLKIITKLIIDQVQSRTGYG
jgi:hypothetical protein